MHPIAPLNFDKQIPKKGDQRQMEAWQRIGTYAAGLALDSAGIKGNAEILGRTDMIVAAGGGERDLAVDSSILNAKVQGNAAPNFLNERLMSDLRPTLFLAQLSNLLAGNISIVHGVTGSSRTFMGEEAAGVDAVRIALARIASGQSDIALVGAAHNGERKDLLMLYEFGDFNLKDKFAPVWSRGPSGGFALGSGGVFLVIESRKHAEARGAKPYAKLSRVNADRALRKNARRACRRHWPRSGRRPALRQRTSPSSRASPAPSPRRPRRRASFRRTRRSRCAPPARASATSWRRSFRSGSRWPRCRSPRHRCFRRRNPRASEIAMSAQPAQIVVVGTGHWRGEGWRWSRRV